MARSVTAHRLVSGAERCRVLAALFGFGLGVLAATPGADGAAGADSRAPVELLERLAFGADDLPKAYRRLRDLEVGGPDVVRVVGPGRFELVDREALVTVDRRHERLPRV